MPKKIAQKNIVGSEQDIEFLQKELSDLVKAASPMDSILLEKLEVLYTQPLFERMAIEMKTPKNGRVRKISAIGIASEIRKHLEKSCSELQIILYNGNDNTDQATLLTLSPSTA
jgi:hypothetical protein